MKFLKALLPRLAVAMLLGLLVLNILDARNPLMNFLTGGAARIYMLIMCVLSIWVIASGSFGKRNR